MAMSESGHPTTAIDYTTIHPRKRKGRIGVLTGGGDVPGLNPAIRAVTLRALD